MFKKILIVNRGEIACRVMKTAREMGIATVAVYSDADRHALHVRSADEAIHIGGAASRESYLKGEVIIAAAQKVGAEAIHPGYGFLSENEDFARACEAAGIAFIGPSARAIEAMGLKDRAKDIMAKAGVPVVPGYQGAAQDGATLATAAADIGWPVLIKAVAGGGGKGMRLVERAADFAEALASCKREAAASFGNDHVLIEKYITRPRHIEVQVFGDSHGNAVYLFERDCSLQRRHQKVVEEAPAPGLSETVRRELGEAAVKAVKALQYTNAGTIEFIMDSATQEFFFMEMNTRLQVEHPVTEEITGQDLVAWQIRVAAGQPLPLMQEQLAINGHAFEVRLYAEDPAQGFLPQTGALAYFRRPPGARVDTGVEAGDSVTIHYDPMVAKIITHGADRDEAARKMRAALAGTVIAGLTTNQEFLSHVFAQDDFLAGDVDTGFIARHEDTLLPDSYGRPGRAEIAVAAVWGALGLDLGLDNTGSAGDDPWDARDNWRMNGVWSRMLRFVNRGEVIDIAVTGRGDDLSVIYADEKLAVRFAGYEDGTIRLDLGTESGTARVAAALAVDGGELTIVHRGRVVRLHRYEPGGAADDAAGEGRVIAPMPGKIVNIMVAQGQAVSKDQPLLVMEAMKMEMTIRAGCDGVVDELPVAVNDQVRDGALLVSIRAPEQEAA